MVDSTAPKTSTIKEGPSKDTRFKTTDVTNTKGMKFEDFGLSKETKLVSTQYLVDLKSAGYL